MKSFLLQLYLISNIVFLYVNNLEIELKIQAKNHLTENTFNKSISINSSLQKQSRRYNKLTDKQVIEICKTSPNIKYNFKYETDITFNKLLNSYEIWCYKLVSDGKYDAGSTMTIGRYLLRIKTLQLFDVTLDTEELYLDTEKAKAIMKK